MNKLCFPIIALLLSLLIACSDKCYYNPMGGWGNMMYYGHGGMFMGMFFIIVVGVVLVYFIIQNAKPKDNVGPSGETPLDILKKRYAKGEITKDEFDRMKRDIES